MKNKVVKRNKAFLGSIIGAVGYYLRYNLSYREVQELLYDRGINVCHTTIYRWVQEYSKEIGRASCRERV